MSRDPANTIVGDNGADKTIFLWGLGWLPHAIVRIEDPLFTRALWAPHGTDLAWVTWTPGAALVAWPVSALAGLVPAYNALALAAPALAAWAAFLFLSELRRRQDVALLGGWDHGFVLHRRGHDGSPSPDAVLLPPDRRARLLRRFGDSAAAGSLHCCYVARGAAPSSTELASSSRCSGRRSPSAGRSSPRPTRAVAPDGVEARRQWLSRWCWRRPCSYTRSLSQASTRNRSDRRSPPRPMSQSGRANPSDSFRPSGSDRVVQRFIAGGAERVGTGNTSSDSIVGLALTRGGRVQEVAPCSSPWNRALASPALVRLAGITLLPGAGSSCSSSSAEGLKPVRLMLYAVLLSSRHCRWLADSPRSWTRWVIAALAALALMLIRRQLLGCDGARPSFFAGGSDSGSVAGEHGDRPAVRSRDGACLAGGGLVGIGSSVEHRGTDHRRRGTVEGRLSGLRRR